jgi:small subunit ribosomal protein S20
MANHFSALKRARQSEKRAAVNQANKSAFRSELRAFREALATGKKADVQKLYRETVSAIDSAASKGTIHRNTAARYKSRLSARLAAMK